MGEKTLTDEDIKLIVDTLQERYGHECRFIEVEPHELYESVKFYKNLNKFFDSSLLTIWRVFLGTTVIALITIIGIGIITKIKQLITGG